MRFLGVLVAAALAVCACASLPVPLCPQVEISFLDTPGGRVYLMDEANVLAVLERGLAIQEGLCRLPGRQAAGGTGV